MGPCGKRKEERRTFSELALDPDPAPMDFDDPPDQSQADARTLTPWIKLVEQPKDPLKMLRGDP